MRSATIALTLVCCVPGLALTGACIEPAPFTCELDDDCGAGGACEPEGYCSFDDNTCHTGRRYGEFAPAELRDTCVGSASGAIVELATGGDHACALEQSGRVWCWGRNTYGALGNGGFVDSVIPLPITGLEGAVQIATGELHSCALDSAGAVWCWGYNEYGQLGDGSRQSHSEPTRVVDIEGAVEIAAGELHSCARLGSGEVYCWGYNDHGQLGDGTQQSISVPVRVEELSDATQVLAAGEQSCARRDDGAVMCWGRNHYGQLGTGDYDDREAPVVVEALENPVSLGLGADHMCALDDQGRAQCVGRNDHGQLGDGQGNGQGNGNNRSWFAPVHGLDQAVEVVAGRRFSCARTQQGVVQCWGQGNRGELGTGEREIQRRPDKPVKLGLGAIAISAGRDHVCGQTEDGCVWCWGSDEYGQLGDGASADDISSAPVPVRLGCW